MNTRKEMATELQIQALDKIRHDRAEFDCGVLELNRYLSQQAALDMKRKAAGCWVITAEHNSRTILGYYTLSSEAVDAVDLPEMPRNRLVKNSPNTGGLERLYLDGWPLRYLNRGRGLESYYLWMPSIDA